MLRRIASKKEDGSCGAVDAVRLGWPGEIAGPGSVSRCSVGRMQTFSCAKIRVQKCKVKIEKVEKEKKACSLSRFSKVTYLGTVGM